ncbi:hypothetical protein [Paracoccus sp. (in: a-proteobacteria)]|uniref:hypothetical protein n=1 Tax=Paracoccus sp. TaxID=267 RepID=UPI0026DFC3DB|nr:hypothetical protein [Paracoccus sp. (in: a-proteobacteria)]MDO5369743.1 hypothetical protein [Paracoccus sp. (in: a-proteobacteria)]
MDLRALFLNDRVAAALVTALVGGGVVAAGWFWTHALSRRRDRQLRNERVADIQRALLAEIRAHLAALEKHTPSDQAARERLVTRVTAGGYLPILPHEGNDRIFRAIVEDVHILPEWAIDPMVRYYRLLAVGAALSQDIRATAKDQPGSATEMMRDYLILSDETLATGREAMIVLTASLEGGGAAVAALRAAAQQRESERIASSLPGELAQLREGLSKRSSDPRGR